MRFRFLADRLFVASCGFYCLNRWILKPRLDSRFLRFWFNDLLLIPCAIPLLLFAFQRLGLRPGEQPPSAAELVTTLSVWSVLFEWIGPHYLSIGTADWHDLVMYWSGGFLAWLIWNRKPFVPERA